MESQTKLGTISNSLALLLHGLDKALWKAPRQAHQSGLGHYHALSHSKSPESNRSLLSKADISSFGVCSMEIKEWKTTPPANPFPSSPCLNHPHRHKKLHLIPSSPSRCIKHWHDHSLVQCMWSHVRKLSRLNNQFRNSLL